MNIRKNVIKISIISALIPIFFLGTYGYFLVKNKISENEMEKIELVFYSQKFEFNSIYNNSKTILNIVETLVKEYDESKDNKKNLNYMLNNIAIKNKEVQNIFWGSSNGEIYTSNIELPTDYDPRSRPWYIGSLDFKNKNLSTITYKFIDGEKGTAITKKVYDKDGLFNGVIGLDINFTDLEKKLKNFIVGKKGMVFVVDKYDSIVLDSGENEENLILIKKYLKKIFPERSSKGNFYIRDIALLKNISRIKIDTPKGKIVFIKQDIPELELFMIGGIYEKELTKTADKIIIFGFIFTCLGIVITMVIVNKFIKKLDDYIKTINTLISEISLGNYKKDGKKLLEFISEDSELSTIKKEIETLQISIEKRESNLKTSAITDSLTGIYNRKGLEFYLTTAKKKYELFDNYHYSIILFDIDNFKKINDTYGHVFGDKVLKLISKIFVKNINKNDQVFRYGGEEFIVLLQNVDEKQGFKIANRLKKIVEKTEFIYSHLEKTKNVKITVSGGIAQYNKGLDIEEFIKKADILMYKAKNSGKNKIM